jgi:hypothetical protein
MQKIKRNAGAQFLVSISMFQAPLDIDNGITKEKSW